MVHTKIEKTMLEVPKRLKPENVKFYTVTQAAYLIGALSHLGLGFAFLLLRMYEMVYFNSRKRSKYAVVGSGVNVTSRIESYTVGGQILASESVYREAGPLLRIDSHRDLFPKGSETPLRISDVGSISGAYDMAIQIKDAERLNL